MPTVVPASRPVARPSRDPFQLMWRWGVAVTVLGLVLFVIAIIDWIVAGSVDAARWMWLAYVGFPTAFTGAAAALFGLVARLGQRPASPEADGSRDVDSAADRHA